MRLRLVIAMCLTIGGAGAAAAADDAPSDATIGWERWFGEDGAATTDEAGYVLAHGFALDDGGALVAGTRLAQDGYHVWVSRLDAQGATVWERSIPGSACSATRLDGAVVVLATAGQPGDDNRLVLRFGDDGAPAGEVAVADPGIAAHAIAPDGQGGFLLMGRYGDGSPALAAYDGVGDQRWTWQPGGLDGVPQGGVMAAVPSADGGTRLLGFTLTDGVRGGPATIWTAAMDADGVVRDRVAIDQVDQTLTEQFCFTPQTYWSIDSAGPGALVRYVGIYGARQHRVTAQVDDDGRMLWQRGRPGSDGASPTASDRIEAITTASATGDGGAIVAGFRFDPPTRDSAGFIARLDADGTTRWDQEWPAQTAGGLWPVVASAVETADGAVLATATEDRRLALVRSLIVDADADGRAP